MGILFKYLPVPYLRFQRKHLDTYEPGSREMGGGKKWYQLKGLFKSNNLRGKKVILLKGQSTIYNWNLQRCTKKFYSK